MTARAIPVLHWTPGEPVVQHVDPRVLTKPTRKLSPAALAALVELCRRVP
ncbi:MAG TPA: hypothetical protein VLN57_20900 [Xanthobacteraceae bacterium]|nr:hypothetical protein [Xanthobacteraceae bacterium]